MFLFLSSCILHPEDTFAKDNNKEKTNGEHWIRPIPLQGSAPLSFSPSEKSLYPDNCKICHPSQYNDWIGSLHSKATGPGLTGQLSPYSDPEFAASCYYCHAPMTEQQEIVSDINGYSKNPDFDKRLKHTGISCSVCHLRGNRRFGPPPSGEIEGTAHGGFTKSSFFEDSEFCSGCHQFPKGYPRINGKSIENTYEEWRESPYPSKGVTCQKCHMPGRRHLFRGIHDPAMVKKGITIKMVKTIRGARLIITNSGTGHFFPTYVTPLVVVRGYLKDSNGVAIADSLQEAHIGRRLTLDNSTEIEDTRIPPEKDFIFDYKDVDKFSRSSRLVVEIIVFPDMFYNRFFKEALRLGIYSSEVKIRKALAITEASSYVVFKKEISISPKIP